MLTSKAPAADKRLPPLAPAEVQAPAQQGGWALSRRCRDLVVLRADKMTLPEFSALTCLLILSASTFAGALV